SFYSGQQSERSGDARPSESESRFCTSVIAWTTNWKGRTRGPAFPLIFIRAQRDGDRNGQGGAVQQMPRALAGGYETLAQSVVNNSFFQLAELLVAELFELLGRPRFLGNPGCSGCLGCRRPGLGHLLGAGRLPRTRC